METKSKTEPAGRGTENDLGNNITLSKNLNDEESESNERSGSHRIARDEDKLHGNQDSDESEDIDSNNQQFRKQNITQTNVPDNTTSSQSLLLYTENLSKVENQDIAQLEKFIPQKSRHDKKDKKRVKDVYHEVLNTTFLCHHCGRNSVFHCNSCNSNFCEKCNLQQHTCTLQNVTDFHQYDEKGHQRYGEYANFPNMEMVESIDRKFTEEMPHNSYSTGHAVNKAQIFHRTFEDLGPFSESNNYQPIRVRHNMASGKFGDFRPLKNKGPNISEKEVKDSLLCEPCFSENLKVQATHFCKTCDDPELLCETCAKHHNKQKLFKNHELSQNVGDFRKREKRIGKEMICEPCSSEDLEVQATYFCKTCDDPEPLCDTCAKHHTKQKLTKNHKMSDNMQEFKKSEKMTVKSVLCEPCSSENQHIIATYFCETCDDPEPLCETCAKYHTKQRLGKNHELCGDIKVFQKRKIGIVKEMLCEPCTTEKLEVPASFFCTTCEDPEPLCDACAKHHTKQKLSKNHELCGNLKELEKSKKTDILCELCSSENIQVLAKFFCKTCDDPEPLCDSCANHHTKQKLSRNHELCENLKEFQKSNSDIMKKPLCEPCSTENLQVRATHFCKTCNDPEPLCDTCAKQHTKQRHGKNHETCKDMEEFRKRKPELWKNKDTRKVCEPCSNENIQTIATHFCKTCNDPEPLCETCAKQHIRQKISKDHKLCGDIQQFAQNKSSFSKNKDTERVCEPCSNENVKVSATHFCKTCDDPEPLCEVCAKQHIRQKISKDHKLCDNIKEFDKNQPPLSCKIKDIKIVCEPCSNEDKQITATHYCKTCKDPEPLCEDCAKEHIRQKISKDHKLSGHIEEFPQTKAYYCKNKETGYVCELCFNENKQITATHFCKTCNDPEPLCEACAKEHIRQKISKDHSLSDEIEDFHQSKANVCKDTEFLCEPCFNEIKQTPATFFCKTCADPEPLCEKCAKQHIRHKISKDHKLCSEIHNFPKFQKHHGKNKDKGKFCSPCLIKKKQIKATAICNTCDFPEPFCKQCAEEHIQQEKNKYHELCDEIQNCFPKKIDKGYAKKPIKPAEDEKTPGKPSSTEINSNSLTLVWDKSVQNVTYYQVRYKCSKKGEKWKLTETDSNQNCLVITGLMAKTEYKFQVRGVFGDVEGPYSPVSGTIVTKESLATHILGFCTRLTAGRPSKHRLPAEENIKARNENARTRQLIFGKAPPVPDEKTILLVGATGSGKSTLVDGFVNYIMGVSFDDPFRFTTAMLEDEEMKTHNQAVSQTEWITVYKLHPTTGSRLNYTLNIIDTPGFGDTRGIERDHAIVDQIRHLFCSQEDDGVLYIDAVCFIVKAPDARLTVVQKYIFSSMMALFGKDIESNICTLITFADGAEPPVLASLKESKLPHNTTFTFNNSALFAENEGLAHNTLSPMFWEMGCRSLERFFEHIKELKATSLSQTKDVLEEREQLKFVISNIRPQITAGLSKLSELQQKLDIFQRCKSEIENNQNFEYTVEETKQQLLELRPGQHVTNCLHCNATCHENCGIPDNEQKKSCVAMDKDGNCRICPEKCVWTEHKNTPYVIKYVTEKVTKTYAEMKERYEEAIGKTITHEKYIEDLTYCVDDMFEEINAMMNEMNRCKTRLKEIALRPDPLSAVEHIDLMILSEQEEKQPGYQNRVKMLKEFKRTALVGQDVEKLGKDIKDARENIKSVMGKSFGRDNETKGARNILARGYRYIKNLF